MHYHLIYFNLENKTLSEWPQVSLDLYKKVKKAWGKDFLFVQTLNNVSHLVNYVSKYFSKDALDSRMYSRKKFFCSKELFKAVTSREPELMEFMSRK